MRLLKWPYSGLRFSNIYISNPTMDGAKKSRNIAVLLTSCTTETRFQNTDLTNLKNTFMGIFWQIPGTKLSSMAQARIFQIKIEFFYLNRNFKRQCFRFIRPSETFFFILTPKKHENLSFAHTLVLPGKNSPSVA